MIYIQRDNEFHIPHHSDAACAMYGAIESAKDYKLITFDSLQSGKYDTLIKSHLFVGSVEFMREVFSRIGIEDPRVPENSNRPFENITLGEARERAKNGEKLFIKPFEIKMFTGFVLDQSIYGCIQYIPDDTRIMAYKVFESPIESEWRAYVLNNKIIDSHNYSGDFKISPDYNYIESIIECNKTKFPCAYTIDVGILKDNTNVIIEYNDMWAIGNYGITNTIYLRALRERYFEIIRNK